MRALRPAVLLGALLAFIPGGRADERDQKMKALILPPYLESVVFDVFSEAPDAAVEVFAPDDPRRPLLPGAAGMEEIRLGRVLKTLVIRRPAPGRWTFRASHPGIQVRILSQPFFPRGALLEPASGGAAHQGDRIFIAYGVTDANGLPLQDLSGYPLTARLVLLQPNGLRRPPLILQRQPELGPGVFRTRERIECPQPGRYWTEVVLTTRDLAGRTVKVLEDRWSGFSVRPAKPLSRHFRTSSVSFRETALEGGRVLQIANYTR